MSAPVHYVVMTIELWANLTVDVPLLAPQCTAVKRDQLPGCGYLPVFVDRGAAERAYPGREILVVEPAP